MHVIKATGECKAFEMPIPITETIFLRFILKEKLFLVQNEEMHIGNTELYLMDLEFYNVSNSKAFVLNNLLLLLFFQH